jgi:hypothetical protein
LVSGGDESTKIQPESVLQTAQGVATTLEQASAPGPVPFGTGVSPIDGAATAASGTVIGLVSAASADLAPRAGEVVGATESAVAALQNADAQNTADLQQVGAQAEMQLGGQSGAGAAAAAGQSGPASALSGALGPLQEAASAGVGGVEQVASSAGQPLQGAVSSASSPIQQVASAATGATGSSPSSTSQPGSSDRSESSGGRVVPVSDGWDHPAEPWTISPGMESDEFGHFHTPVVPIDPGGAGPGSVGGGSVPV